MTVARFDKKARVQVLPDLGYEANHTMPDSGLSAAVAWVLIKASKIVTVAQMQQLTQISSLSPKGSPHDLDHLL